MKKTILFLFSILVFIFANQLHSSIQDENAPFLEEEISFKVDNITISGSLNIPNSSGPHPVVVLISGSFADNRDAELYGFRPFKLIAEHLSSYGIAVLRYDDRGIGKSTGKHTYQYTVDELSEDVFSAIDFLKKRDDINSEQIGLIGHSLGGIIAPLVASKSNDVAFIISMAGPVTRTDEINLKYRKELLEKNGKSKLEVENDLLLEKRIIEVTRTGNDYEKLIPDIKTKIKSDFENLNEKQKKSYGSFEKYFPTTYYGIMLPFINTPFLRSWFNHKPEPVLNKLTCPALFLFGGNDGQIKIKESGPIIINALDKAGNYNYNPLCKLN